jgi:hypothetical protein
MSAIFRNDVRPDGRAPEFIREAILRIGGITPYMEPMYRLIVAESRFLKCDGTWTDWPDYVPVPERGGLIQEKAKDQDGTDILVTRQNDQIALRTVREIREFHYYGNPEKDEKAKKGWVLERWLPAHCFGSREQWNRTLRMPDDEPMMPYPQFGDYEFIDGPCNELPGIEVLRSQIAFTERNLEKRGGNPETRMRERVNAAEREHEKARNKYVEDAYLYLRDKTKPIWGSSLAAGRLREELARKAGLRIHVGN